MKSIRQIYMLRGIEVKGGHPARVCNRTQARIQAARNRVFGKEVVK